MLKQWILYCSISLAGSGSTRIRIRNPVGKGWHEMVRIKPLPVPTCWLSFIVKPTRNVVAETLLLGLGWVGSGIRYQILLFSKSELREMVFKIWTPIKSVFWIYFVILFSFCFETRLSLTRMFQRQNFPLQTAKGYNYLDLEFDLSPTGPEMEVVQLTDLTSRHGNNIQF